MSDLFPLSIEADRVRPITPEYGLLRGERWTTVPLPPAIAPRRNFSDPNTACTRTLKSPSIYSSVLDRQAASLSTLRSAYGAVCGTIRRFARKLLKMLTSRRTLPPPAPSLSLSRFRRMTRRPISQCAGAGSHSVLNEHPTKDAPTLERRIRASQSAPFDERITVRVCPKTSGGITKFSEHEAD
jgi:hypothetical protein